MMLRNKIAVIYGAGGAVGGALAGVFAREGATLFLCGRQASAMTGTAVNLSLGMLDD